MLYKVISEKQMLNSNPYKLKVLYLWKNLSQCVKF